MFRKKQPSQPKPPRTDVWIERDGEVLRFFFRETLQEPNRQPDDRLRQFGGLLSLATQEDATSHPKTIRMYRNYLAVDLRFAPDNDHIMNPVERRDHAERFVLNALAEYFGWMKPVVIGDPMRPRDRHRLACKLGVNWTLGSLS